MEQESRTIAPDAPRESVFTIPNILSFSRIVLGLCFPWIGANWRVPVLIVGALTDLFDGALGRWLGGCSRIGRVLDPLADKVFMAGIAATLLWDNTLTVWEVAWLVCRDLVVIGGTLTAVILRHWDAFRGMAPTLLGKATTAAQFGFFLLLFLVPQYKMWLLMVVAGLSVCAGGQYLSQFLIYQMRKKTPAQQ